MRQLRLVLIPLFRNVRLQTDLGNSPQYLELDAPQFDGVLPYAQELHLYTNTVGLTSGLEWNVVFVPGWDRDYELGEVKIGPPANITANGPVRHAAYTDTSKFLLHGRLRLLYKNTNAGSQNTALVSAALGVLTYGA